MWTLFSKRYVISASVISDVGNIRQNNEDNYYLDGRVRVDLRQNRSEDRCQTDGKASLFAVCDGMGGEDNGEIASLIAVQNLSFDSDGNVRDNALADLREINRLIEKKRRELKCRNMGSTVAALFFWRNKAIAYNVGDSRVYLCRGGKLKRLSQDHNETSNLVESGLISEEDAKKEKGYHVLTQYLGVPEDEFIIEPYFSGDIKIKTGDIFIICSDGVTDMITDDDILELIYQVPQGDDAYKIARKVVDIANEKGGKDNITALVAVVGK